jgi:hypothetical protein
MMSHFSYLSRCDRGMGRASRRHADSRLDLPDDVGCTCVGEIKASDKKDLYGFKRAIRNVITYIGFTRNQEKSGGQIL